MVSLEMSRSSMTDLPPDPRDAKDETLRQLKLRREELLRELEQAEVELRSLGGVPPARDSTKQDQ
jgi:hypothetical protein